MQLTELLERIKASPLQSSGAFSAEYRVPVSSVSHSSVTELTDSCLYEENSGLIGRSTRIIQDILTFFQSSYTEEITSALIEQKYGCNYDYINRLFKSHRENDPCLPE